VEGWRGSSQACNSPGLGLGLGHAFGLCSLTHADVSNETRQGSQGFQCVVYFCDTTFELMSPQLVGPGDAKIKWVFFNYACIKTPPKKNVLRPAVLCG